MTENNNPLNKYFRQPAIYVSLPSGTDYPPHVITPAQTGELGVMPMTAKDEIRFKTPDALMNGQGVVDVIQSCVPDIKDAWQIKSYDLDTILVAIRIATYGETMEINFNVPGANENVSHTVNLPSILDQLRSAKVDSNIVLKDGLKITVRPLTYQDMTSTSLQTFQQQKMYSAIQDSQLSDEEKAKRFNDAFKSLTDLNASILLKNINSITMTDGTEITDPAHIKEFVDNANATLIKEIEQKLTELRGQGAVKPLKLKATEEQIKKGAPATYEVPVTFDTSNFFRITLLSQTESDIIKTLKDMENSQKELKHELVKISWYMRGGLSYSEAMALSPTEREIIAQLVKDNLETTKKSGQPFF